ncbi:MAG: imidazole glycerol phosphate synthase subunit HisH [Brevinematia bacterium]
MVGVIDYGAGNIRSMVNAILRVGRKFGVEVVVSSDVDTLKHSEKLILPGVGAFADVMANLRRNNLDVFIKDWIASGRKFMGVCVGLQVLFEVGYEGERVDGLGIFRGEVVRFSKAEPIPHIGWNQINVVNENLFFSKEDSGKYFYFVHSYYAVVDTPEIVSTTTEYKGEVFVSSIFCENLFAVQFHPEKSHLNGEEVIRKFLVDF